MTKIAFIGAGSVVFTQGLLADLFSFDLGHLHIALHDIDPERLDTAAAAASYIAKDRGVTPRITAHLERRAALADADFVINIVQVGMNAATRSTSTSLLGTAFGRRSPTPSASVACSVRCGPSRYCVGSRKTSPTSARTHGCSTTRTRW
jgi:hypothetical protein